MGCTNPAAGAEFHTEVVHCPTMYWLCHGWNASPPPSPSKISSQTVSPARTCVPLSWNPAATNWLDDGWAAT